MPIGRPAKPSQRPSDEIPESRIVFHTFALIAAIDQCRPVIRVFVVGYSVQPPDDRTACTRPEGRKWSRKCLPSPPLSPRRSPRDFLPNASPQQSFPGTGVRVRRDS